ncbi:MAG TPA: hypothetical protein VFJ43_04545, partial [Bacteroidia bacterium]|nr:hypothetical protein [Bacteroidia bacterium]
MRRIALVLIFFSVFFTSHILHAQNWGIYKSGDSLLYYMNGHTYDSTSVFIQTDSILVTGSDTTFIMNRKVIKDPNSAYSGNQPFIFQRNIIHFSNDVWELNDTANWFLHPKDSLLSSWIFDSTYNINATISRIYSGLVLGQNDSIKTISLSNGDSILVSKNHGIIDFPSSLTGTSKYAIAAYNHSVTDSVPGFFRMFAFQPGDIMEYTSYHYSYCLNAFPTFPFYGNFKDSIISVQYSPSSVMINLYQWSHITHDQSQTYSQDTITRIYQVSNYRFLDYNANNSLCNYQVSTFFTPELMQYENNPVFNCKTKHYYPLGGNNYSASLY